MQDKIEEVEAESIALVVSNRLGLDTADFNMAYIATWSDGDIEKFKNNIDVIRSVSYQILSSVEPALQTYLREKEKATESIEEDSRTNTLSEAQLSDKAADIALKEEETQNKKVKAKNKKSEVEHA